LKKKKKSEWGCMHRVYFLFFFLHSLMRRMIDWLMMKCKPNKKKKGKEHMRHDRVSFVSSFVFHFFFFSFFVVVSPFLVLSQIAFSLRSVTGAGVVCSLPSRVLPLSPSTVTSFLVLTTRRHFLMSKLRILYIRFFPPISPLSHNYRAFFSFLFFLGAKLLLLKVIIYVFSDHGFRPSS